MRICLDWLNNTGLKSLIHVLWFASPSPIDSALCIQTYNTSAHSVLFHLQRLWDSAIMALIFFCRYNKTEGLLPAGPAMQSFTHLLIEGRNKRSSTIKPYIDSHEILDVIEGFSHLSFNYQMFPPIKMKTKPQVFILRKNSTEKKVVVHGTTKVRLPQKKKHSRWCRQLRWYAEVWKVQPNCDLINLIE